MLSSFYFFFKHQNLNYKGSWDGFIWVYVIWDSLWVYVFLFLFFKILFLIIAALNMGLELTTPRSRSNTHRLSQTDIPEFMRFTQIWGFSPFILLLFLLNILQFFCDLKYVTFFFFLIMFHWFFEALFIWFLSLFSLCCSDWANSIDLSSNSTGYLFFHLHSTIEPNQRDFDFSYFIFQFCNFHEIFKNNFFLFF